MVLLKPSHFWQFQAEWPDGENHKQMSNVGSTFFGAVEPQQCRPTTLINQWFNQYGWLGQLVILSKYLDFLEGVRFGLKYISKGKFLSAIIFKNVSNLESSN